MNNRGKETKEIENQSRLKTLNLNSILIGKRDKEIENQPWLKHSYLNLTLT